jgi:hypothetical protein
MGIKLNALLLTLGALIFGVGLILGLTPMSQSGSNCGAAFSPNEYSIQPTLCNDTLSSRRGIALALVIPGALLALGGVVATGTGSTEKAKHGVGSEETPIL